MSYELELQRREKRLQIEVEELQLKINQLQSELGIKKALLDQIIDLKRKAIPIDKPQATRQLREGGELALARDAIKAHGSSMHLDNILMAINKKLTRENKASLAGSLNRYSKEGQVFCKEGPNTYGLLEFKNGETMED